MKTNDSEIILKYLTAAGTKRSNNSKMAILTEMFSDECGDAARQFVHHVLDPKWNYYMTQKTLPEPKQMAGRPQYREGMLGLFDILGELHRRELSGQRAQDTVANFLALTDVPTRCVFKMAIERQLPGNIGRTLVNKVQPGLIYKQPYGGVKPFDPDWVDRRFDWSYGVLLQTKEDGMTLMMDMDSKEIRTRQGQDVTAQLWPHMKHLWYVLGGNGKVYHFEAMLWDRNFKALLPRPLANGEFNALFQGDTEAISTQRLMLVALDCIEADVFYGLKKKGMVCQDRYEEMQTDISEYMTANNDMMTWPQVECVKMWNVYDLEEARSITQRIIAAGGEGAILKDPEGVWKSGKMTSQMKLKNEFECTLMIVGRQPHSKNPDWLGSLLLTSVDGKIQTKAGSGLNEDPESELDRRNIHSTNFMDGQLVEVRAEKISKNNALDLPRIVELRVDKDRADTYEEVLGAYRDSTSLDY